MVYTPDAATSTIFSSLLIYGVVGTILTLLFEYVRSKREIYAPRLRARKLQTPAAPSRYPFSWIPQVLAISDAEAIRMIGLDAFVFLSFLKMCIKLVSICGITGMVILVPVYVTAPFNSLNAGVNRWTMGNIMPGGSRLWMPLIFSWIFTAILLGLLYKEYENYCRIQQVYLRDGDDSTPRQASYSVIVDNIPLSCRYSIIHMKLRIIDINVVLNA